MKGLVSRRPSPALVVAIIALVVAMFGTAYAATQLPKNSVGTKQLKAKSVTTAKIKKEAVTAAKVKKHTLTGNNINLEKLGTVPSANLANVATTANALAPMEATHLVGAPGEPPFQSGSVNYGTVPPGFNLPPVGFFKDHDGVVHLEGIAKPGEEGSLPGLIFTLPPGYRPASGITQIFVNGGEELLIAGSNVTVSGVNIEGDVIASSPASVLSGITFRAGS